MERTPLTAPSSPLSYSSSPLSSSSSSSSSSSALSSHQIGDNASYQLANVFSTFEATEVYLASSCNRLHHCLKCTLQSRYFYANAIYCIYCMGMLCIDFVDYGEKKNDRLYNIFGIIHFINAWMYWYAWEGVRWSDPIVYPEYLNAVGAALYLWSSTLYQREQGSDDAATSQVHVLETCAAFVELFACVGWAISWHASYERGPGRGYTLEDPDVWALLTIFAAAVIYVIYNLQIIAQPSWYGTDYLYFWGDVFYAINGALYLIAGLRDDGWFWWMPLVRSLRLPIADTQATYTTESRVMVLNVDEIAGRGGGKGTDPPLPVNLGEESEVQKAFFRTARLALIPREEKLETSLV